MKRTVRAMIEAYNNNDMVEFERLYIQAYKESERLAGYVRDEITRTYRRLKGEI